MACWWWWSGWSGPRCASQGADNWVVIEWPEDAFGAALLDYLDGSEVPDLTLEVDGGVTGPAMHPEWFFRDFEEWEWLDRGLLRLIDRGPVLDLGARAGRAALCLQRRSLRVTAVDVSPGRGRRVPSPGRGRCPAR
jgi:hypothetical protein